MRTFMTLLIVAAVIYSATPAQAQENTPPPAAVAEGGINGKRLLAIGVGVIAGSFLVESLIAGQASSIIGGVGGGLIAGWWYNQTQERPSIDSVRYREASATAPQVNPMRMAVAIRHK